MTFMVLHTPVQLVAVYFKKVICQVTEEEEEEEEAWPLWVLPAIAISLQLTSLM